MIIVDASVALKWAVDEPGRASALEILKTPVPIGAPDLLFSEVSNALRKKFLKNEVAKHQALEAVVLVKDAIQHVVETKELAAHGLQLAFDLDHSVYDCMYLASALTLGAPLVTADSVFLRKCAGQPISGLVVSPEAFLALSPPVNETVLADITRLTPLVEKTIDTLSEAFSQPIGSESLIVLNSKDLESLFQSPAYRRLRELFENLTPSEAENLLALAWLGRDPSGSSWDDLKLHARLLIGDAVGPHISYLVGLMSFVPAGLTKWQALHSRAGREH